MLEFRQAKKSDLGVDMTPMIDCVFQLLIFFLLSSSFLTPAVRLNLPKAAADKAEPIEATIVTLDATGQLFLNKAPVIPGALKETLAAELRQAKQKAVVVRADKALAYEKVLEVLVTVQQAGANQVRLAYEVGKEGK